MIKQTRKVSTCYLVPLTKCYYLPLYLKITFPLLKHYITNTLWEYGNLNYPTTVWTNNFNLQLQKHTYNLSLLQDSIFYFFKINVSQRKYFSITVIQVFQHKKNPWGSQKYRQKIQCKRYSKSWFCTGAAFTFDKPLLQQSFVSEFLLLHTYIFLSFPIPHWIYQRILYYPSTRWKLSDPSGTKVSWNYFYTIESLPPKYYTISQHTSLNQFLLSVANRKPAGIACRLKFTMEFN